MVTKLVKNKQKTTANKTKVKPKKTTNIKSSKKTLVNKGTKQDKKQIKKSNASTKLRAKVAKNKKTTKVPKVGKIKDKKVSKKNSIAVKVIKKTTNNNLILKKNNNTTLKLNKHHKKTTKRIPEANVFDDRQYDNLLLTENNLFNDAFNVIDEHNQALSGPTKFKPYDIDTAEGYMNEQQLKHFESILHSWKQELMMEVDNTISEMKEADILPDSNDRATQEETFNLELKTRDRERKLIKKIESAIAKINEQKYGYCDSCGVEIGIRRLEARPTATLCIECKTLAEIREKRT